MYGNKKKIKCYSNRKFNKFLIWNLKWNAYVIFNFRKISTYIIGLNVNWFITNGIVENVSEFQKIHLILILQDYKNTFWNLKTKCQTIFNI